MTEQTPPHDASQSPDQRTPELLPTTQQVRSASGRSSGMLLMAIGVVGLVLSLVATVAGWVLVDGAVDSIDDSLELTDEALVALDDTIEIAGEALGSTSGGIEAVRTATENLDVALSSTADVLAELDTVLGETVPSGIDSIRQPVGTLATTSRVLTDVLAGLALFGVNFQPDAPLDESVDNIDAELEILASQLRNPEARIGRVGEDFSAVADDLDLLRNELSQLASSIEDADALLENYEGTTERATLLVAASRGELAERRTLARAVVILIGVLIALGQLVPIMIGRRWMNDAAIVEVSTATSSGMSGA